MSELRCAVRYSIVENKHVAITHATTKLRHYEYPEEWLRQPENTKSHGKSREVKYDEVLKMPFINDAFNARVHAILKCNNLMSIRLVNPRPNTIEEAVKKSTPPTKCNIRKYPINALNPDCTRGFVVYEAICVCAGCGAKYVGSTTRPLYTRAREHTYAASRHDENSAIGTHYGEKHPGLPICITSQQLDNTHSDQLRLCIKEVYWIKKLQPILNRKAEEMGTGFLV